MRAEPEEKSIIRDVPASRQDDDPGKVQNNLGSDERRRAGRRSEEPGLTNILRADPYGWKIASSLIVFRHSSAIRPR